MATYASLVSLKENLHSFRLRTLDKEEFTEGHCRQGKKKQRQNVLGAELTYNTYQRKCEFLEQTHNQPNRKPKSNNRWLEQSIHSVETVKGLLLIKRKASQQASNRTASHKENPQTEAPVAFPHRP